jgi:hypothetical protein
MKENGACGRQTLVVDYVQTSATEAPDSGFRFGNKSRAGRFVGVAAADCFDIVG